MGIYDRDYVFRKQRSGLTVTAWLILICSSIFLLQFIFERGAGLGWPVYIRDVLTNPNAAQVGVREQGDFQSPSGNAVNMRRVGELGSKRLVNAQGEVVGERLYASRDMLTAFGHFSTYAGVLRIEVWRLITFQFLHGSILHILFNMLGLWTFGRLVEEHLGSKRYLAFYLMCGISGGLMYLLLNLAGYVAFATTGATVPGLLVQHVATPLIGASAGVFGVIVASAKIAPNDQVSFFGLIPMKLSHFAYGYVILSLLMLLFGARNAGGEAAHLGGAIAGFYFIRNSHLLRDFFDIFGRAKGSMQNKVRAARGPKLRIVGEPLPQQTEERSASVPGGQAAQASKPKREMPANLRAAMDAALAKQMASGTDSLTSEELEALRKATAWLQSNG
jgi:membrane associated rhomboid family serine protease